MNQSVERARQRARLERLFVGVAVLGVMAAVSVSAQRGGGAAPAAAPQTPQASAPIDLTGYWVSIVNEDWRWRMVTPPKGDYASVPISPEGRKVADTWDVSKDGSCMAFGAAGLMRMPTRLNITWENPNTLKLDTDAGQQTRRLVFDKRQLAGFWVRSKNRDAVVAAVRAEHKFSRRMHFNFGAVAVPGKISGQRGNCLQLCHRSTAGVVRERRDG